MEKYRKILTPKCFLDHLGLIIIAPDYPVNDCEKPRNFSHRENVVALVIP